MKIKLLYLFILFFISFANANTINMQKGWQLLGSSYTIKNMSDFNNSKIKIVWAFNKQNKQWKVYSPLDSLQKKINSSSFKKLEQIEQNQGFWILSSDTSTISLKTETNTTLITVSKGWQLLGTSYKIDSDIFNKPEIKILWSYDALTKNWEAYSPSSTVTQKLKDSKIKILNKIPAKSGFWILADKDVLIQSNNKNQTISNLDLAHPFGIATEGTDSSYQYYEPAGYAIDNNNSTYNHTSSKSDENWLQIELPKGTKISSFMIEGRHCFTNRLENAKVYILSKRYSDQNLSQLTPVATLKATSQQQLFSLTKPENGNFLLIKAEDGNNLHIVTVEIYGKLPENIYYPVELIKTNYLFGIPFDAKTGTTIGSLKVKLYNKKDLTYTVLKDDTPFIVNSDGDIRLSKSINYNQNQKFVFDCNISDNNSSKTAHIVVKVLSKNGVRQDRWYNISGSKLIKNGSLEQEIQNKLQTKPDEVKYIDNIDFFSNKKDNFLQRDSAIFKAKKSGFYTFSIIGDDATLLSLSTDDTKNRLKEIAQDPWWGHYQDFNNGGKSKKIYLDKGELHYLEALLKEEGGSESLSVAYKINDDTNWTVIPKDELFLEVLTKENLKPKVQAYKDKIIIDSIKDTGEILEQIKAYDLEKNRLSYTLSKSDLPFSIDKNGNLTLSGDLQVKTYDFDIIISDGVNSINLPITIVSKEDTYDFNSAKNVFYKSAKAFTNNSNLDELIKKYLDFAHLKEKNLYESFMQTPLPQTFWDFIANDDYLKEGLYASRFPANPYVVKNLYDFNQTLKSDFTKYKNLALGLSINAKESGIFSEVRFGDTSDHPTIDYTKISQYQEKENRWKEHFDFANLGYDISYYDFQKYLTLKYNLEDSEKDSLYSASSKFKAMSDDGISIETADYETRKKYNLSFAELNLYRLTHKMQRADCSSTDQPCYRIDNFIQNKGLTKSQFLADFGKYKNDTTLGLINPRDNFADFLRGELGVIPKDKNDYRLMSFKDLANWKIMLDNIEAVDFGDKEPNWPIFKTKLQDTPWQIFALEQSAQKQECGYIKQRFFETDKSKLEASYPPNAVDGGAKKDRRFIEYTTYTWDYNNPKIWYRESEWTPNRSYYRILQDGGVCGRQSTMGQHANECLNRPSIGTGQPGHRAWIGIYNLENNQNQLYTKIGYRVGSYESATPHSNTIYNHYTKNIRESGMEKFTGVVTGTSSANSGERTFNKSMILQHIAKIMEDENNSSVEALLKKAITIAPTNIDAWYQLALYYATQDKYQKVIDLAKYFMDTRDNFFLDLDSKDGADNLEIVTAKNIAFAINFAPSINFGKGDKAEEGRTLLWNYLDTYENTLRSIRSYRNQNRYLSNLYLVKLNDQTTFISEIKNLFSNFLVHGGHKNYYTDYFNGVDFHDINKTQLFDDLETMTQQADLTDTPHDRTKIIEKLLGRSTTSSLAEISIKDICLNNNLKECQSIKSFELDAKAVYIITTNNATGEDKEVDPTNRGEEGYSTLVIPAVDENGNDLDIKVRAAKIAITEGINGKLLKINDPTEVQTDKTKIILWIDPSDNTLDQGKVYHSSNRILLKAKKRVTNNEEFMGDIIIDIQNLLKGNSYTFNGSDFLKTYKDDTTSVYFVTNTPETGSTSGVWAKSGYTVLSIKVKDNNNNNEKTLKLRATNDNSWTMNSGLTADWDNTLKIYYDSSDNPDLNSGTRYKSILPTTIDALMWHKQNRIKDRIYLNIDFTVP